MSSTRTGEQKNFSAWVSPKIPLCSKKSSMSTGLGFRLLLTGVCSPAARLQEERILHEAKLAKMEAEMKMVFQQKVAEKEAKLKQSEEELYARHKEMKDALEKQRADLEDKKRRIESGRPASPAEKSSVRPHFFLRCRHFLTSTIAGHEKEGIPPHVEWHQLSSRILFLNSFVTDFVPSLRLSLYITLIKLRPRLSPSSCLVNTPHSFHHISRLLLHSRSVLFYSVYYLYAGVTLLWQILVFELIYHGLLYRDLGSQQLQMYDHEVALPPYIFTLLVSFFPWRIFKHYYLHSTYSAEHQRRHH
jgi:hypothetical protein